MKVSDIVERYGMKSGTAMARDSASSVTNQNKRANAQAADSNREANIANKHAERSAKRKRYAPTGVPSRLLQPQAPAGPEGEQQ